MTDGGPAHLPLHLQPLLRVALAAPAVRDVRARQVDGTLNHLQDDDLRRKHQWSPGYLSGLAVSLTASGGVFFYSSSGDIYVFILIDSVFGLLADPRMLVG